MVNDPVKALLPTLVSAGRLTQLQMERSLRVEQKLQGRRSLESILVETGLLCRRDLKTLFTQTGRPIPLGLILVERELVSPEAIDSALFTQKEGDATRLGELLCQRRLITADDLLRALAQQRSLTVYTPVAELVDAGLMQTGALAAAFKSKNVLPLRESKDGSLVLFSEPPDAATLIEIERLIGRKVRPALADAQQIAACLRDAMQTRGALTTEAASVRLFDRIMARAVELGASDVHIEPLLDRLRVRLRVDGELEPYADWPPEETQTIVARAKVLAGCDLGEHRKHQDGRFARRVNDEEIDCRVSIYASLHGENVVIRLLRRASGILRIDELGMAPAVLRRFESEILGAPTGVVLITGPTGAGKTSTLYSAIAHGNKPNLKVITVEDPIELTIDGIVQCQINERIGQTFSEALRAIVRQDPDVIVLGEIRDAASADVAIQAALTGHKVFSTLHTEDAIGGLLRLQELDIEAFLISSTVICVVAQRLLRRICPDCMERYVPEESELKRLGFSAELFLGVTLARGRGCGHCRNTGYRGRIGVYELLVVNDEIKHALLKRSSSSEVRGLAMQSAGLVTLQESALALASRGVTTLFEIGANIPRHASSRSVAEIVHSLGYEEAL
jgi:type IV pilus assembly protein PilB